MADLSAKVDAVARAWIGAPAVQVGDVLRVGGEPVMYGWERPLMDRFARALAGAGRDVLEIGYGMGVFASCVQEFGARSHTIVEAHPQIAAEARRWAAAQAASVRVVEGFWQETVADLGPFDAVFYDSFSPPETLEADLFAIADISAEHLLRPGGRFAFWTIQEALSESLQKRLLQRYERVELTVVRGLPVDVAAREAGLRPDMLAPVCFS